MEMEGKQITIKSNYNGDMRRFLFEKEDLSVVDLHTALADLYNISLEGLHVTTLLDSERVILTTYLLRKLVRKGLTLLRVDVQYEQRNDLASISEEIIRDACRTHVLKLLNSKSFIDSIVEKVVPVVTKNLEQSAVIAKPSKNAFTESDMIDRVLQSVRDYLEEESYEATTDTEDIPPLPEDDEETHPSLDDSVAHPSLDDSDSEEDETSDEEIEDPQPIPEEEIVEVAFQAPSVDDAPIDRAEHSDPDDFEHLEIVNEKPDEKPAEIPNEKPKQPSQPIIRSLFAFIKNRTVDRIRSTNEHQGSKDDEIPNLDQMLQQLADMGFHDRDANIAALKFHRNFKEGLDEVIEDLLSQKADGDDHKDANADQNASMPMDADDHKDVSHEDIAESPDADKDDVNEEVAEMPISSPIGTAEVEMDVPREPRGRLNSNDLHQLMSAGMTREMAVRTLMSQMF